MRQALLVASLLAAAGAGCLSEGSCPPTSAFAPGTYQSNGGAWRNPTTTSKFPHETGAASKALTLERGPGNAATVRISYLRGGKMVVERWAMTGGRWSTPGDGGLEAGVSCSTAAPAGGCVRGALNGCCDDVEQRYECHGGQWRCPAGAVPWDACCGYGSRCQPYAGGPPRAGCSAPGTDGGTD